MFFNRPLLIKDDVAHSHAEPRWHALGKTEDDHWLHITFTLRYDQTKIRIISARDMQRKERTVYEKVS